MTALASTVADQPAIMPPSPAKMNRATLDVAPELTTKSTEEGLNTIPVGSNVRWPGGSCTTRGAETGCALPLPSYSVAVLVWLFATQTVPLRGKTIPHGLTRLASLLSAPVPAESDTSFVNV